MRNDRVGDIVMAHAHVVRPLPVEGFRYAFANGQRWGAGIQPPLSDTEGYD
jgi:hypothetical protein